MPGTVPPQQSQLLPGGCQARQGPLLQGPATAHDAPAEPPSLPMYFIILARCRLHSTPPALSEITPCSVHPADCTASLYCITERTPQGCVQYAHLTLPACLGHQWPCTDSCTSLQACGQLQRYAQAIPTCRQQHYALTPTACCPPPAPRPQPCAPALPNCRQQPWSGCWCQQSLWSAPCRPLPAGCQ
jgi:hypothetical protein